MTSKRVSRRRAHIIEQTYRTQPVEPAFLEPEACLVVPQGKGVKVHTKARDRFSIRSKSPQS